MMKAEEKYLDLKTLAACTCLSVRTLREYLKDGYNPLPCHRLAGKILVYWPDFKEWIARYKTTGEVDIDQIVKSVCEE